MSSGSWLGTIWTRIRGGVIQDVPPSLEACESCREVDCERERWLTCAKRLAGEAERLAEQGFAVGTTANSGEIPSVSSQEIPAAAVASDDRDQREQAADSPKSVSSN
jgi:hypothetical protein